jgi:mRNA interferase RelE/StbE
MRYSGIELSARIYPESRQGHWQTWRQCQKRIGTTLLLFKENPLQYAERLTDPELGGYRFRIGDYRIIFDVEGNDIIVLRASHRKEIYKRK